MLFRGVLAASIVVCLAAGTSVLAQTITYVEIQVPNIQAAKENADAVDGSRYVQNVSSFGWTILESDRISLQHPLDFIALTGDFELAQGDAKASAAEIARLIRAITTQRIVLLPNSRSALLDKNWNQTFVASLRANLQGKIVTDLTSETISLKDFTLVGVNAAALEFEGAAQGEAELKRLEDELGSGKTALLFACVRVAAPSGKIDASSLWALNDMDRKRWSRILVNPKLAGLFLSVDGTVGDIVPSVVPPSGKEYVHSDRHILHLVPPLESLDRATESSRGFLFVQASSDGGVETKPILMRSRFVEEAPDQENVLIQADIAERDQRYEEASRLYGDALKSKDPQVRVSAEVGLRRVSNVLQEPWERWRKKSIVVDWLDNHWRDLCIAFFFATFPAGWLYFRRRDTGSPRIIMPAKLIEGAPAELYLLCLLNEINEIRDTWARAPTELETTRDMEVDLAPDVAAGIVEALPKLIGDEAASAVKVLLFSGRYFAWRIETSVYGNETDAAVYARLCWGWTTLRSWIVPKPGEGAMNVRECASTMAYNLTEGRISRR